MTDYVDGEERRHTAKIFRDNRLWLILLGGVLMGWHLFLISGCIALVVAVPLVLKLPYSRSFTPETVAGASLLFAGWAYVAMALASRKAKA
ncbi:MAG: hypothetical protein HYX38_09960 [Rhodospirillales bacterium]|nr:hypothetical protein [Rhodospirillales bacterium]